MRVKARPSPIRSTLGGTESSAAAVGASANGESSSAAVDGASSSGADPASSTSAAAQDRPQPPPPPPPSVPCDDDEEADPVFDPDDPDAWIEDPGFQDFVFKISLAPGKRSVERAIQNGVFGRWRRGLQAPMKLTFQNFWVPNAKLLCDLGVDIILAEDLLLETIVVFLPERHIRYMCKWKLTKDTLTGKIVPACDAKKHRIPTSFPCPKVQTCVST